jgi:hypothetical protein
VNPSIYSREPSRTMNGLQPIAVRPELVEGLIL